MLPFCRCIFYIVLPVSLIFGQGSLSTLAWAQSALENPTQDAYQSGIGIIAGWKCTGKDITAVFDDRFTQSVPYGSSRADTRSQCGDENNGFGLLVNWNLLGDGTHTVKLFDDGVLFASSTFQVKTLGHQFLSGLTKDTTVVNFGNQINVTLRWQQSTQSFVIVDATAPLRVGPPTGVDLGATRPLCEFPDEERLAAAQDIAAFAAGEGYLQRQVNLCAVSPDNPRYSLVAGNAISYSDGNIFYDVTLVNEFCGIDSFADTAVIAHEVAHQIQWDNPSQALLYGKGAELQADCLSGLYFGHLAATDPTFTPDNMEGIFAGICGIAVGRNFSWANIATHGTCEERSLFFALGLFNQFQAELLNLTLDPFIVCG